MAEVEYSATDGVAVVTLNAPQRRNALTPAMAGELIAVFDQVDADSSIAVTIIRGAGGSFCAGADVDLLRRIGEDPAQPRAYDDLGLIYESFLRLRRLATPTIAAVQGAAVGAGMNLLLAADLRVLSSTARLICGFLRRGVLPGGGHFVMLSQLVGREMAAAMALFGEELNGTRAVELGLAAEAVPHEDVDTRALELAQRAAGDPELLRRAIKTLRDEVDTAHVPLAVAAQAERANQMWSMRRQALQLRS